MSLPTSASSSILSKKPFDSEQAFKQFSLETERLEMTYQILQERFKKVQLTLQESHTRLSGKLAELDFVSRYLDTILQHMSQGIIFIDLNGIVTTYNTEAQNILQISEKKLLFHPFNEYFDDLFLGFSLKEAFTTKKNPPSSLISLDKNEKEIEIEATFVAMNPQSHPVDYRQTDKSKPIQGLLILLRDVTKLHRLQQLAYHHDTLKELGELAAHLAHEIRNPLGGIRGFAALLQQELKEQPDLQQMASYIVQGADDLNQLVSNVLRYARPMPFHVENIDIVQLIKEIEQFLKVDSAWNSRVNFIFQSPIPSLIIPLDPHLFKSALLNLFINAIQAMPEGGDLKVTLEPDYSWITLYIEDTGQGITEENLAKIFSPFFTTKQTGNGLGLSEVQKVIQSHQGKIEVRSQIGKGTTFIIKIPSKLGE